MNKQIKLESSVGAWTMGASTIDDMKLFLQESTSRRFKQETLVDSESDTSVLQDHYSKSTVNLIVEHGCPKSEHNFAGSEKDTSSELKMEARHSSPDKSSNRFGCVPVKAEISVVGSLEISGTVHVRESPSDISVIEPHSPEENTDGSPNGQADAGFVDITEISPVEIGSFEVWREPSNVHVKRTETFVQSYDESASVFSTLQSVKSPKEATDKECEHLYSERETEISETFDESCQKSNISSIVEEGNSAMDAQEDKNYSESLKNGEQCDKCAICKVEYIEKSELIEHMKEKHNIFMCLVCRYKCSNKTRFSKHYSSHAGEKPFVCDVCSFQSIWKNSVLLHIKIHPVKLFFCHTGNCKFRCLQKSDLDNHVKRHNKKVHACERCSYETTEKDRLETHIRKHTGEKPYKCTTCSYSCAHKSYLKTHMGKHTTVTGKLYLCPVCGSSFCTLSGLHKHKKKHENEKPIACTRCDYKCSYNFELELHKRKHTDEKPYMCSSCGWRCNQLPNLAQHMKTKHSDQKLPRTVKCLLCESSFLNKRDLTIHVRRHTGERPYKCTFCNNEFTSKSALNAHLRKHSDGKAYKCTFCDKRFTTNGSLNTHLRKHGGEPYQCSLCDYRCFFAYALTSHMHVHHGEKSHHCSLCDFSCYGKSDLKVHTRTHTKEKPYGCTLCDHRSARKSHLDKHIKTHYRVTQEKPLHCSECGQGFSNKYSLGAHMKRHAAGEKPHKCATCDYATYNKHYLGSHMRIHTGEKPFTCFVCSYRCSHKYSLDKHMKTHE